MDRSDSEGIKDDHDAFIGLMILIVFVVGCFYFGTRESKNYTHTCIDYTYNAYTDSLLHTNTYRLKAKEDEGNERKSIYSRGATYTVTKCYPNE